MLIWNDQTYANGDSFLKFLVKILPKDLDWIKFDMSDDKRGHFRKLEKLLVTFCPENVDTYNQLIPKLTLAMDLVEEPVVIEFSKGKKIKLKLQFTSSIADFKTESLNCGCKGANSKHPCFKCFVLKREYSNFSISVRSPLIDHQKAKIIKNQNLSFTPEDCKRKYIFENKLGIPRNLDILPCGLHFFSNKFGLLFPFLMDLMSKEKRREFVMKVSVYAIFSQNIQVNQLRKQNNILPEK